MRDRCRGSGFCFSGLGRRWGLKNEGRLSIRALAVLTAFVSVAALATQAFATISNPAADQRMLVGSDVVAPVVADVKPASEPKVPLIRVAPGGCPNCDMFDDG
jgi:hypothetical protein